MKKLIGGGVFAALLCVSAGYAQAQFVPFQADPQDFPPGNTFLYFPIAPVSEGFSWALAVASVSGAPTAITIDSLFLTGGAQAASLVANFAPREVQFHFPTGGGGGDIVCPSPGCQIFVHRPTFSFWALLFVINPNGSFSILTPLVFAT